MEFIVDGYKCLVDDEDWWWVKELKLRAEKLNRSGAQRYLVFNKMKLHQLVFKAHGEELLTGNVIDHINRKSLDNRYSNLRQITNHDNFFCNRRKTHGTSKYIGVSKFRNKWRCQCTVGANNIYLGVMDSELEAALLHDVYLVQNYRNPLRLNFPEEFEKLRRKE